MPTSDWGYKVYEKEKKAKEGEIQNQNIQNQNYIVSS